jgi:hypothetical protein
MATQTIDLMLWLACVLALAFYAFKGDLFPTGLIFFVLGWLLISIPRQD